MVYHPLTFVTYCTPGRFTELADDLAKSCEARGYRAIVVPIAQQGHDMNFYGHAMTKCLPVVDQALCGGPVALVDADHLLVGDVPDTIWPGPWKIAAINRRGERDMVQIYGVAQNYLSSVVILNHEDGDFARMFMLEWTRLTFEFGLAPSGHKMAQVRDDFYRENDWKANWFCDQAALNRLIERMNGISPEWVQQLPKEAWSARKADTSAILVHFKGVRKKGYQLDG